MGLMRGMARTAVIAGTATHVSNNVSRRQARRYGQEDAQAAAAAPAPVYAAPPVSTDDAAEQIAKLGELLQQGLLTQQEFDAKKQQILGL